MLFSLYVFFILMLYLGVLRTREHGTGTIYIKIFLVFKQTEHFTLQSRDDRIDQLALSAAASITVYRHHYIDVK